ncbi:helix-turn-helix domain-containing protein [Lactococcus petauri]|uniref:helix-turn-helix domain-containing protein n=1 Tax=Lactococcus petauri TaxID=1940789 RepID=UPI00254C09B8|nr:helix-turn-helix transcriptional regulator [Lactococcus petauri]
MTLVTRYTFKDLRMIKGLTFEQVSDKTDIPVDQIKAIEKDSSDIKPTVYKKLSKLYDIDTNYICIGEQSYLEKLVLDKFMQSEIYQKASLSKKLTPIEVAKLEKKLGLNEFSLFQAILDISKEGDNEQPT